MEDDGLTLVWLWEQMKHNEDFDGIYWELTYLTDLRFNHETHSEFTIYCWWNFP
jgi:hypothetical protein